MAERVGFEPTIPVKVCPLSRRIVSTTHAPLRIGQSRDLRLPAFYQVGYCITPGSALNAKLQLGGSSMSCDRNPHRRHALVLQNHSRSTLAGSVLVARRAGSNTAAIDVIAITAKAAANATGSRGFT